MMNNTFQQAEDWCWGETHLVLIELDIPDRGGKPIGTDTCLCLQREGEERWVSGDAEETPQKIKRRYLII
jgi:hypothetical protein